MKSPIPPPHHTQHLKKNILPFSAALTLNNVDRIVVLAASFTFFSTNVMYLSSCTLQGPKAINAWPLWT